MVNTNTSWYQYPNKTDSESLLNLFGYINRQVEGVLFPTILLVIWFVAFIGVFASGGRGSASKAFTFASFLNSLLSMPLAITGFLSPKLMFLFFIMTAIGALWIKLDTPAGD